MARQITWSGHSWTVRAKSDKKNPGPNAWGDTSKNVRIDKNGHLILAIWDDAGKWRCADVTNDQALGYGTYRWVVGTNVTTLDPNAVFGLFTYDLWETTPPGFNEIDIEATRWGDKNEKRNVWFTAQPDKHDDMILPSGTNRTFEFTWRPDKIDFKVIAGTSVTQRTLVKAFKPNDKTRAIMDLWLMLGRAPISGTRQAVRIVSFKHTAL